MTEQKHTPGPWKQNCFLITAGRDEICHVGFSTSLPPSRSHESEANAEFIVRACNSHYDLLEACKAVLPQLEWANIHGSRCEELLEQMRCAIRKAEGGAP